MILFSVSSLLDLKLTQLSGRPIKLLNCDLLINLILITGNVLLFASFPYNIITIPIGSRTEAFNSLRSI